jgi:hypothetical protein
MCELITSKHVATSGEIPTGIKLVEKLHETTNQDLHDRANCNFRNNEGSHVALTTKTNADDIGPSPDSTLPRQLRHDFIDRLVCDHHHLFIRSVLNRMLGVNRRRIKTQ